MSEWFGVKPFTAIRDVVHVLWGSYGIHPLSRPVPCTYYFRYIHRFYRDDFVELGSTQSEEYKRSGNEVSKNLYLYVVVFI